VSLPLLQAKHEAHRLRKALEAMKKAFAMSVARQKEKYEAEIVSMLPSLISAGAQAAASAGAGAGTGSRVTDSRAAVRNGSEDGDGDDGGYGIEASPVLGELLTSLQGQVQSLTGEVAAQRELVSAAEAQCEALRRQLAAARSEVGLTKALQTSDRNGDAEKAAAIATLSQLWSELGASLCGVPMVCRSVPSVTAAVPVSWVCVWLCRHPRASAAGPDRGGGVSGGAAGGVTRR
jgi:hypothetical protein